MRVSYFGCLLDMVILFMINKNFIIYFNKLVILINILLFYMGIFGCIMVARVGIVEAKF